MNGTARRCAHGAAQRERGPHEWDDGVAALQRNQHVADGEAVAPDRIDHRMTRRCRGIDQRNCGIVTEVARQIERQLNAGRELGKILVDAELEVKSPILMPQHDRRGHRRVASPQGHDFALASFGESRRRASDEGDVAIVLSERGTAPRLPAAGLQREERLERVRDIRSSERRFYQKVLDIYATSVDYSPDTEVSQRFFATVQNKMHWAAHGHTAAEVIHERADARQPRMGLQSTRPGGVIRKDDVSVAKNYLTAEELDTLNRIVSLYIGFAELQALDRKPMTMRQWVEKLDEFLKVSSRELLTHAGHISAEAARANSPRSCVSSCSGVHPSTEI